MSEKTYRELLNHAMHQYYIETLGLTEYQLAKSAKQRYEMVRGEAIVALLEKEIGIKDKNLLDVGSGWGEVVYKCLVHGAKAHGIEPYKTDLDVASALIRYKEMPLCFSQSLGEALPFPDNSFDIVICNHVLEHVQSPPKVIEEIVRVTALHGHIFLAFPNYIMPFEGHYRVPWIPFMSKIVGTQYLKLLGRNPNYFQNFINYVTYKNVLKILHQHPVNIRCLSNERLIAVSQTQSGIQKYLTKFRLMFGLYKSVTFLLTKYPT